MRQFDKGNGRTAFEVSGFGRVQTVEVQELGASQFKVTIYESGISTSTESPQSYSHLLPTDVRGGRRDG